MGLLGVAPEQLFRMDVSSASLEHSDNKQAWPEVHRPMKLVKSKRRVADHGEVFTPAWMVEAMLVRPYLPMTMESCEFVTQVC